MDKEHILSEIRRTAEENEGRPLGIGRFEKQTQIKSSDWRGKYWTKWADAIAEAGYDNPPEMQAAYSDDFLLEKLVCLVRELGHFPTATERRMRGYQDKDFPTHNTFARFGRKGDLIQAVLRYCEEHDASARVVDICRKAAVKTKPRQGTGTETEEIEYGFVYLMKSGKHFKIGHSSCAEMRHYQLRILMPEKLELIHKIKTDDPPGIEAYWQKRFKEKRRNGEWFALSSKEVKAFKRRRTM